MPVVWLNFVWRFSTVLRRYRRCLYIRLRVIVSFLPDVDRETISCSKNSLTTSRYSSTFCTLILTLPVLMNLLSIPCCLNNGNIPYYLRTLRLTMWSNRFLASPTFHIRRILRSTSSSRARWLIRFARAVFDTLQCLSNFLTFLVGKSFRPAPWSVLNWAYAIASCRRWVSFNSYPALHECPPIYSGWRGVSGMSLIDPDELADALVFSQMIQQERCPSADPAGD